MNFFAKNCQSKTIFHYATFLRGNLRIAIYNEKSENSWIQFDAFFNCFSLSRLRDLVGKIAISTTSCQSLHLSGAKEFLGSSPHRSTKHWVASVRSVWFTTTKSNIILVGSQQKTLQKSEQQIIEGKPLFLLNFDVRFIGLESVVTSEKRLIWFYVNFACCKPILFYYFLRVLIFRIFSCLADSKVTFPCSFPYRNQRKWDLVKKVVNLTGNLGKQSVAGAIWRVLKAMKQKDFLTTDFL